MRLVVTLLFTLALCAGLSAQEDQIRKNTISFESGIYDRGLVGISYSRSFLAGEFFQLNAHAFGGFGHPGYRHTYYGMGLIANFGSRNLKFSVGSDFTVYRLSFSGFSSDEDTYYAGFSPSPFIGFLVNFKTGLTCGGRIGIMPVFENSQLQMPLPKMGFSVGYSF